MKILKENILNKKRYLGMLIFLLAIIFIFAVTLIILYKNRNHPSPFENRVIQSLSFVNFPFMERSSFFFPPSSDPEEKISPEKTPAKTVLEEAGSMKNSKSDDWWLNSGGIMSISFQEFSTNIGALSAELSWRKLYAKTNPNDTDNGYFPQNIFRLVTRYKWKNFSQSVYFNIEKINLSESKNRNESNGVLLFNRYQDGDNLYYIGLRVDGDAVIKKKIAGKYYTLAEKEIFSPGSAYDKDTNPNLIPENTWIGIKSEVSNADDGSVNLKLYMDREQNGNWQLILEMKDKDHKYGTAVFSNKGYAGLRTDFMDVKFENYSIQKL
jgi:hypothetical protein